MRSRTFVLLSILVVAAGLLLPFQLAIQNASAESCTQSVGQGTPGTPTGPGFGNAFDKSAVGGVEYCGRLYMGTIRMGFGGGAEIWRYEGPRLD